METITAAVLATRRPHRVRVTGAETATFAAHLDVTLSSRGSGSPGADLPDGSDSPHGSGLDLEVVIQLRARRDAGAAENQTPSSGRTADIVVDMQDPTWQVIRYVDHRLPYSDLARRRETQTFFAIRAAAWDAKFGDDLPAYAAAVAEAGIPAGATVADVGCGTGRALPALRAAVGETGSVLGVDLTAEMLRAVRVHERHDGVQLLRADAQHLP